MRTLTSLLFIGLALGPAASAQKKADKKMMKLLRSDITYLASDELEGRRTGTEGERKAADYIERRYREAGISPYRNQYRYPFHFTYGKEVAPGTRIVINGSVQHIGDDVFPLPFSGNGKVHAEILPDIMEQSSIWMAPLYTDKEQANDPHFDAEKYMFDRARELAKQGATGVVFFDSYGSKYAPTFNKQSLYEALDVPVIYLSSKAYHTASHNETGGERKDGVSIDLDITVKKAERTGTNIAAYIDNKSRYTVILGAHYDHLGYGEDENSRLPNATKEHRIHHGADDNASGTAALLQMAEWIQKKKLNDFNYLFVNFSGEELGLFGSKQFIKDEYIDSAHIAYMINMDMLGRLNDSTRALTIGGVGTSPSWGWVTTMAGEDFKVVIDSSGQGPSDHTSFYNVGIPVLFFFTGLHTDYHKPTDLADRINYKGEMEAIKCVQKVVTKMDQDNMKPVFTPTRQQAAMGRSKFKVTLGIMPDYTYSDGGVRVDGVTDNRPAMKAGVKQGDIITQLGAEKITGMQTYMEALGKFAPGDKTTVTVKREGKELQLPIELGAK